ncbi:MAG: hemolysin III family protein, partial [bacterium]
FEEEIANSVSHGAAFLAALAAAPFLIYAASKSGGAADILGTSVFATAVVLLYLASTLSHALPRNRGGRLFENLDQMAIYLLIAGTYTPFTLGVLRGAWGWTLLGLVWGLAAAGIALRATGWMRSIAVQVGLYVLMGWLALIAIQEIWLRVPAWGLFWIFAGGGAYTVGLAFFGARRIPYHHLIWHLFVILGTACHFVAVMWYAG